MQEWRKMVLCFYGNMIAERRKKSNVSYDYEKLRKMSIFLEFCL